MNQKMHWLCVMVKKRNESVKWMFQVGNKIQQASLDYVQWNTSLAVHLSENSCTALPLKNNNKINNRKLIRLQCNKEVQWTVKSNHFIILSITLPSDVLSFWWRKRICSLPFCRKSSMRMTSTSFHCFITWRKTQWVPFQMELFNKKGTMQCAFLSLSLKTVAVK